MQPVELLECELITFDMYFSSVATMQFHPGAGTKEHKALSIDECKDIALQMIEARRSVGVISLGGN